MAVTAAVSSKFPPVNGTDDRSKGDGFQTQRRAGQVRTEELLAKAITIDGREEWYCRFCGAW